MVTDGNKGWAEGTWLNLPAGPQWVQIDLKTSPTIHGVLLWHYYAWGNIHRDVVVQIADDADFVKNLRTVFNNDDDNTSGFGAGKDREFLESNKGQWIPIAAQRARFVRLYSSGNSRDPENRYTEVEVWATPEKVKAAPAVKPTPKPTPPPGMMVAQFELPQAPKIDRPGTSRPYRRYSDRGPVLLPVGSKNVALRKPVTSSDDMTILGTLSQVTDGYKEATEGSWVELGPGTQWVEIDLQASFDIHGILFWHRWDDSRVYRDVVVQLADDAEFTKNVRTEFNTDQDNSSGLGLGKKHEYYERREGNWIPIKSQKARYVRLYSRGNTSDAQNQYTEVEVWATLARGMVEAPFKLPQAAFFTLSIAQASNRAKRRANPERFVPCGPVYLPAGSSNIALHKPVTSSDETRRDGYVIGESNPFIGTLNMVTDGEKESSEGSWVALKGGTQWVQIDLQKPFTLHGVLLWHYHYEPRVYRDVIVQVSNDVDFILNVRTVFNNDADNSSGFGIGKDREYYEHHQGIWIPLPAEKARYVRLYSQGNTSGPLNEYCEVEVWGTAITAKAK